MFVSESLLRNQLREGQIYLFKDRIPFGVPKHMHICLKKGEDILYFVCCTTKLDTIKRFLDSRGISYTTLVGLNPDGENALDKVSYINYNNVKSCPLGDFITQYRKDQIESIGEVGEEILNLILAGIQDSPIVEKEVKQILQEAVSVAS